ncbi:hypothetical protein ACHAWF_014467 [Thalassiosira exigua]
MDHSFETNRQPGGGGSGGGGAGGVRRRPPTAPYPAGPGTGVPSSSHTYGTANDEDSPLLRREDEGGHYGPGTLPSHARASRRRHYGPPPPWYRQPHKLILAATLAWAGGVMYLASLAHALLRTHKEAARAMGSNLNDADFQAWLESQASARQLARKNKYGDGSSGSSSGGGGNSSSSGSGTYSGKASDEDVTQWIESQGSRSSNAYGAGWDQDEDFQKWLEEEASNRYGSPLSNVESSVGEERADFQAWMGARANKLGSSGGTSDSGLTFDEEVQKWLETHYGYGASAENIEDFQKWKEERSYGASAQDVEDSQKRMESRTAGGSGYGSAGGNVKGNNKNVNVRFGSGNPNYEDWKEYREKNKHVKYDAEGQNDRRNNNLGLARATTDQSLSSKDRFQQKPAAATTTSDSDADASSVSTIDWPLQGLPHASCTSQNGCSPNANVTVLVVYGPEYHTHIADMAWNVAAGVHQAFKNHIRHHPSTPLHGHIVFGTTGNLTFLDVIDADAVIIGSPVYNGNVHPDVQNWINYWHIDADLSNKFGGAFATAGGIHAGADGTVMSILRSMMVFQMMAVGGDSWTSPFGAVATMYEDPFGDTQRTDYFDDSCYFTQEGGRAGDHLVHPYFLRKAYGLGERIANVTVAWKNSSYVRWG